MNRDGAMICCLCVYARCTAPAICQHSVVTSVEGALTDWDKREREIERERFPSPIRLPYLIFMSFCHLFICMAVTDLIMALALLQLLPMQHSGMEFWTCVHVLHRVRTHTPASPITAVVRCTNMTETIALIICTQISVHAATPSVAESVLIVD